MGFASWLKKCSISKSVLGIIDARLPLQREDQEPAKNEQIIQVNHYQEGVPSHILQSIAVTYPYSSDVQIGKVLDHLFNLCLHTIDLHSFKPKPSVVNACGQVFVVVGEHS